MKNDRREIARGLHNSVVQRTAGIINRVSFMGDIVFTGGVARNPCMVTFPSEKPGRPVLIPDTAQFIRALGAVLPASEIGEVVNQ